MEDGSFICPACDQILDASFLDEGNGGDEGTDPGLTQAPVVDDEGTDPGTAPALPGLDDNTDPGSSVRETGALGAAGYTASAGGGGRASSRPSMPEAPPRTRQPDPEPELPLPPSPPPRPGGFTPEGSRPAAPSSPRVAPPITASGTSASGSFRERVDFDVSSQMMDDYERLARDGWRIFLGLPIPEKTGAIAILVALVSVLFPWAVEVAPTGAAEEHLGVFFMGWLSLILAGGSATLFGYRHLRRFSRSRLLLLGHVGLAALGLLWAMISFAAASRIPEPAVNPRGVDPGATYGLMINLLAWLVAGFAALISLKDAPEGS